MAKKKASKKKAAKKAVKKTNKKVAKKTKKKAKGNQKKLTKSQLIAEIAEATELAKKDIKAVLETLGDITIRELSSVGQVRIPGIETTLKKKVVPAKPKRKGTNPFTGETQTFKAKPKSVKVKATIGKKVREQVSG